MLMAELTLVFAFLFRSRVWSGLSFRVWGLGFTVWGLVSCVGGLSPSYYPQEPLYLECLNPETLNGDDWSRNTTLNSKP